MAQLLKNELGYAESENIEKNSEIQRFFSGCNVLLTGGTGFLGKLLLEKLLRSCNINKIYVLVREKKGKSPEKRLQELFEPTIFDGIKKSDLRYFSKIILIEGDCSLPNLGLSELNLENIVTQINSIFHCAATVRFDEKIRTAAYINVRATRDLLLLSKSMKNLKSFVYVSTAYSYCPRKDIEEVFYEPDITGDNLLLLVEALSDDILEKITPKLLGEWPNPYVFTKSIAEQVLRDYGKGLPVAMVRPSIVISTAKEPVAGWVDNVYGTVGASLGIALGLIRVTLCDSSNLAEMVPADYVINCTIAASWDIGRKVHSSIVQEDLINDFKKNDKCGSDIEIYNYVSSSQNPISWKDSKECAEKYGRQIPSPLSIWYPFVICVSSDFWYRILIFLLHTIPAYIADFLAYCIGKQPMLVKGYKKIHKFLEVLAYFSTRQWNFHDKNTQKLWKKLNQEDKHLFQFDIGALNWDKYYSTYVTGGRIYLLKDPMDTVPQGKRKHLMLITIHYAVVSLLLLSLYKLLMLVYKRVF